MASVGLTAVMLGGLLVSGGSVALADVALDSAAGLAFLMIAYVWMRRSSMAEQTA